MGLLQLSFKNLVHKRTLSILTILAVTIASALVAFIFLVNKGLEKGVKSGYGPYELVLGADGSSSQLVMNTFYHFGVPVGNIPYEVYENVLKSGLADKAYPIARGDSYKGYSIVGTTPGYLTTRYPEAVLKKGSLFKEVGDVVVGSHVAESLSMKIGDTFHGMHGINSEEEHGEFTFKVVGILPKLGTPDDKAIFTPIESVWKVHQHEEKEGKATEAHAEGEHAGEGDVTAVVVKPKGLLEAQSLKAMYTRYNGVQAAYSGKALSDILSIIDTGAQVIKIIAVASILIAGISVLLSLSAMAAERKKDIGLLRLLGKPKSYVFYGLLLEANLLTIIGILLGILAGHVISFVLRGYIFQYAGIELQVWTFLLEEIYIVVAGIIICSIAALFPAVRSYKVDPVKLFVS